MRYIFKTLKIKLVLISFYWGYSTIVKDYKQNVLPNRSPIARTFLR